MNVFIQQHDQVDAVALDQYVKTINDYIGGHSPAIVVANYDVDPTTVNFLRSLSNVIQSKQAKTDQVINRMEYILQFIESGCDFDGVPFQYQSLRRLGKQALEQLNVWKRNNSNGGL